MLHAVGVPVSLQSPPSSPDGHGGCFRLSALAEPKDPAACGNLSILQELVQIHVPKIVGNFSRDQCYNLSHNIGTRIGLAI